MRLVLSIANAEDLPEIYRLRHAVYASEIGQYEVRPDGILSDADDIKSTYITASLGKELVGFIGITLPISPRFSVDKYISRKKIPITFDSSVFEIRALTVKRSFRGYRIASCLMYSGFRWVQAHGGKQILSVGRREVLDMYLKLGLQRQDLSFQSGRVTYDLIIANTFDIAKNLKRYGRQLERMKRSVDWKMEIPFSQPSECFHGGAFFDGIGATFDDLSRRKTIINADVLDAWFPPAPAAQRAVREHLEWSMRTSPPTQAEGLEQTIAGNRGVEPSCILTGGGSSALIFLAFRYWLTASSRVLILDPTYGEYRHVLENIVKCRIERFPLYRNEGYRVNLQLLKSKLSEGFDLCIWVNPNSPTGLHVPKADIQSVLMDTGSCRRVWIDETYVDYTGPENSLESFAARSKNVIVCKSMSKVYALSGLRAAYLCASPHQLEELRAITPPWSVSLPAQIAAVFALKSADYYLRRYDETHALRLQLVSGLRQLGITEIILGCANFILFHLDDESEETATILTKCRERGLYLRDASGMGSALGNRAIRIAVKDAATNRCMLAILADVLNPTISNSTTLVDLKV